MFCVPGESYLPVLDALLDAPTIDTVTCRHESGAAMMAEAHGKLFHEPGVCFVTRGPGATNAAAGMHIAHQDSTPMVLFIGQVARSMRDREAFQEVDYRQMFAPMSKWVGEVDDPSRISELIGRAFQTAVNGRSGPVVLSLPEDVLTEMGVCPTLERFRRLEPTPSAEDMTRFQTMLSGAERPIMIVGGRGWSAESAVQLRRFAGHFDIPVATAFRYQDRFDNEAPQYVGDVGIGINPDLAAAIKSSDLVVAVGVRLGEITTSGYTLLEVPRPKQPLVHIYPGMEELGRVYQADLAINADPVGFARALCEIRPEHATPRSSWRKALRRSYLGWSRPSPSPGPLQLAEIIQWLREELPRDAIVTNGAGNYAAWVHRHFRYRQLGTQVAPTSGSMGYGLPAAIAAKLSHPDRTVVAFAGDGCFLMTGQELATAVERGLGIVLIIVNNGMYGTIRMHQERRFPGRVSATSLRNPDFTALALAYGAHAERVNSTEDFAGAFRRAIACGRTAVLELHLDPEAIAPNKTLSDIRMEGLARREGSRGE